METKGAMGNTAIDVEKLGELAIKLYCHAHEVGGTPALEEAYRRAMLRYLAGVEVLESASPGYARRLREVILERAAFLYDKLTVMRRIEKKGKWNNRLRDQLTRTLMLCEALHDQVAALDRQLSQTQPPEVKTYWGIPISPGWNPANPVFRRRPDECDCFRHGVLRCGVACVWAWPPGARIGSKAMSLKR